MTSEHNLKNEGFHPMSQDEVRRGIIDTLTREGLTEPEVIERVTTVMVHQQLTYADILTDDIRTLISMSGITRLMEEAGVDPEFHLRTIAQLALDREPKRRDLREMAAELSSRLFKWEYDRRERKAKEKIERAERQARREREAEEARIARKAAIEAEEAQELADVALDSMVTSIIDAQETQEPVLKKAARAAKKVIAPKQAKKERKAKVRRKAGAYLPEKTQRQMGWDSFQRYLHSQAFGDEDD